MRSDKLEVDNPMYLRDLEAREAAEDAEVEVEDLAFTLEDKVCGGRGGRDARGCLFEGLWVMRKVVAKFQLIRSR